MKVLIDATTTQDQFASRGIGVATFEVVKGLLEKASEERSDDEFRLLLFKSPTTLHDVLAEHGDCVKTVDLGACRPSGKFDPIWWRVQYLPKIKRVLREEKIDVYYAPYIFRGLPTGLVPIVAYVHDFAFPIMGRYSSAPRVLDWIRKYQYHHSLRGLCRVEKVVTNSDRTRKDLLKFVRCVPDKRTETVYLGIGDEFKKKTPNREVLLKYLPQTVLDRGYILYFGGVEINKNVPGLIAGYKEFVKMWGSPTEGKMRDKPPFLVLAGGDFTRLDMKNPQIREVRDMIRDLELEENIEFTGYYDREDAPDLINGAMMFVHLSLYEGFGFSVLEAMRCGIPVVASNRSCYPEVLGEGAILVDPDRSEDVARACMSMALEREAANIQARKGKERAQKYTWESTADQMYKALRSVAPI